jgi:hypothetical protein
VTGFVYRETKPFNLSLDRHIFDGVSIRTPPHLMGEIPLTDSGGRINLSVNEEIALDGSTAYMALSNFTNSSKDGRFRLIIPCQYMALIMHVAIDYENK